MRAAIRAKVTAARLERAEAGRASRRSRAARAPISTGRGASSRRRRRCWSRSAGCRAPASRCWRARSRRRSAPPPGAVVLRSDVERKTLFGKARARAAAAGRLHARGDRARLCRDHRQGAPRASPPVIRRSSMRCSRGPTSAQQAERTAADARRALPRPVPRRRPGDARSRASATRERDASDADADGRARAGELRSRRRSTWHRVDASGTPDETLQRAHSGARMNDAARTTGRQASRAALAVGARRLLHLHQSLFAAGAAAGAGARNSPSAPPRSAPS